MTFSLVSKRDPERCRPFFCVLALLMASCSSEPADDPAVAAVRSEMQAQFDSLSRIIEDLRDTPERRLLDARALLSEGNTDSAEKAYRSLIERYPNSEEAAEGRTVLSRIEGERAVEREAANRRQRLRFLALPVERSIAVGPLDVAVREVSIRNRWIFDRYDDSWHYRDARRGSKYLVAELTLTADAESHNPLLPQVVVFRAEGDLLQRIGVADYEFFAWDDYGSYLGNTADYGNDFAYSRSIRFSAALEVQATDAEGSLYVLVGNSGCVMRSRKEYGSPEVYYSQASCSPPQSLTVDQAAQGFHIIRRLNAD